jgi:hypothetical protein
MMLDLPRAGKPEPRGQSVWIPLHVRVAVIPERYTTTPHARTHRSERAVVDLKGEVIAGAHSEVFSRPGILKGIFR